MGIFDFFKKKPKSIENDNGYNNLFDKKGRNTMSGNKIYGEKDGLWEFYENNYISHTRYC